LRCYFVVVVVVVDVVSDEVVEDDGVVVVVDEPGVVVVVLDDDGALGVVVVVVDEDGALGVVVVVDEVVDDVDGGVFTTAGGLVVTTVGRSQAIRAAATSALAMSFVYFMVDSLHGIRKRDSVGDNSDDAPPGRCDHTQ
jgi:hypothetical protein